MICWHFSNKSKNPRSVNNFRTKDLFGTFGPKWSLTSLKHPRVTTHPRGLKSATSRPADFFPTAAVPGRSGALDVCGASPNAAAALGDAAEATFKRKLWRYQTEIRELRSAGIVFRPVVWTADGRPHPAATRTLKYAAQLGAIRNSQQASASLLLGLWRHEVQSSILWRRAGQRVVLPRPSNFQQMLLTGNADRCSAAERREEEIEEEEVAIAGAESNSCNVGD